MAKNTRSLASYSIQEFFSRRAALCFWAAACLMAAANLLLSYFPLTVEQALWVILVGFSGPIALFFIIPIPPNPAPDRPKTETWPSIPAWIWTSVLGLAVFLRCFRLDSLSTWPTVDEGVFGYFACHLSRHWDWRLLENTSQLPALYSWGQGLLFRCLPPSLFSLWLYPAFWSLACLGAGIWAFNRLANRSSLFLFVSLMATGFWPLYLGRLSIQGGFLVFVELLCLGLLARALEEPPARRKWISFLTLSSGLGFYTYLAWPLAAFFLLAALATALPGKARDKIKKLGLFAAGNILLILPLVFALRQEYRGYFQHIWAGPDSGHFLSTFPLAFIYLRNLFWGIPGAPLCMGAVWGGLFNPLVGSCFLIGLIVFLRSKNTPLKWTLLSALPLFFIPALLTTDLEMTRLVGLIPFIFGGAVWGIQFLLSQTPKNARLPLAALLLAGSMGLDLFQFLGVYPNHWRKHPEFYGAHKSPEYAEAYSLLKVKARTDGPGLILLNEVPDPYDQTLATAVAGFNAAENPAPASQPHWAAVLTNIHALPFLSRLFPQSQWVWLSQGLNRPDGGFLLGIIEVTPKNETRLKKWAGADQALDPLVDQVMEEGVDPDQSAMLAILRGAYPLFQGDAYLESAFWRLYAIHEAVAGLYRQAAEDETKALQKGFPQADLYNERGLLKVKAGDLTGAKEDFALALKSRLNETDAGANLMILQKQGNLSP